MGGRKKCRDPVFGAVNLIYAHFQVNPLPQDPDRTTQPLTYNKERRQFFRIIGSATFVGIVEMIIPKAFSNFGSHPTPNPDSSPAASQQPAPSPSPTSQTSLGGITPYIYRGHTNYVHAVAWSPDSKRIASALGDGTVQVWDAVTGVMLRTYRGHTGYVHTVARSPDSKRIASRAGSSDNTVQVWQAR
jgi:WD40 repeat protein